MSPARPLHRCGLALLAALGLAGAARAQEVNRGEAPTPDSVAELDGAMQQAFEEEKAVLGRFPGLRRALQHLPPFLRDTHFNFYARTYYFDHWRADGSRSQAWAIGGALTYRSGWIFDAIRIGAALYTSQPLYAPEDRGGTGLLGLDQQGYTVPGQAYLEMRYGEDHDLTLYRQIVDLPYVNKADTRMTPNTFEAYLVRGSSTGLRYLGEVGYVAGWIDKIRRRGAEKFVKMSKAAGVPGGDDGLATATMRIRPREDLEFGLTNHFVNDAFNTFYLEGSHYRKLSDEWGLRVEGQFTSQVSVGDELIRDPTDPEDASVGSFDTWNAALRLSASWKGAIFTAAGSATGDSGTILRPYGLYPGYLGLMISDFDRPGEEAFLLGLSYDFKGAGVPGLSAFTNYAAGFDAASVFRKDEQRFSDQHEVDLTVDYVFPDGWLEGLWLRLRGAWRREQEAPRDDYQLRVILNYDIPIL
jgi:hypothetical protein